MTNEQLVMFLACDEKMPVQLFKVLITLLNSAELAVCVAEQESPERRFFGYTSMRKALDGLAALNLIDKSES